MSVTASTAGLEPVEDQTMCHIQTTLNHLLERNLSLANSAEALALGPEGIRNRLWLDFKEQWAGLKDQLSDGGTDQEAGRRLAQVLTALCHQYSRHQGCLALIGSLLEIRTNRERVGGALNQKMVTLDQLAAAPQSILAYHNSVLWQMVCGVLEACLPKGLRAEGAVVLRQIWTQTPSSLPASMFAASKASESVMEHLCASPSRYIPDYIMGLQVATISTEAVHWVLQGYATRTKERQRHLVELLTVTGRTNMIPLVESCTVGWWQLDENGCLLAGQSHPALPPLPIHRKPSLNLVMGVLSQRRADKALGLLHKHNEGNSGERCKCVIILAEAISLRIEEALGRSSSRGENGWMWSMLADQLLMLCMDPRTSGIFEATMRHLAHPPKGKPVPKNNWLVWMAAQCSSFPSTRQLLLGQGDSEEHKRWEREGGREDGLLDVILGFMEGNTGSPNSPVDLGVTPECLRVRLVQEVKGKTAHEQAVVQKPFQSNPTFHGASAAMQEKFAEMMEYFKTPSTVPLSRPDSWWLWGSMGFINTQDVANHLWDVLAVTGLQEYGLPGEDTIRVHGQDWALPVGLLDRLPVYVNNRLALCFQQWQAGPEAGRALSLGAVETYARLHYIMPNYLGRCLQNKILSASYYAHHILETKLKELVEGDGGDVGSMEYTASVCHMLVELLQFRLLPFLSHYHTKYNRLLFIVCAKISQCRQRQLVLSLENLLLNMLRIAPVQAVDVLLATFDISYGFGDMMKYGMEHLQRFFVFTICRLLSVPGSALYDSAALDPLLSTNGVADDSQTVWVKKCSNMLAALTGPLTWAPEVLAYMPRPLAAIFQNSGAPTNESLLESVAKAEQQGNLVYRLLHTDVSNEKLRDWLSHGDETLFLCIVWKALMTSVMDMPGATQGSNQLYKNVAILMQEMTLQQHYACVQRLLDYVVTIQAQNPAWPAKSVQLLKDLVWIRQIVPLNHAIMALSSGYHTGPSAHKRFELVDSLLLGQEFQNMVGSCQSLGISSQTWHQDQEWARKHYSYHKTFPEYYDFQCCMQAAPTEVPKEGLPVYYGNTVLRFLPVYELVLARLLEYGEVDLLLRLLRAYPYLWKMHSSPVRAIYTLLSTYHACPALTPEVRAELLASIDRQAAPKQLDPEYYRQIIKPLGQVLTQTIPECDMRFAEADSKHLAVQTTLVDLLALPQDTSLVVQGLIGVLLEPGQRFTNPVQWTHHLNTIALLLAQGPTAFRSELFVQLTKTILSDTALLRTDTLPDSMAAPVDFSPNVSRWKASMSPSNKMLALVQAVVQHTPQQGVSTDIPRDCVSIWPAQLPAFLEKFVQQGNSDQSLYIHTEYQLLYLCHLVGPFVGFLGPPKSAAGGQAGPLLSTVFSLLQNVNQVKVAAHDCYPFPNPATDRIIDFMYHLKYTYVCEDAVFQNISDQLPLLDTSLQTRLQFLRRSRQ